MGPIVYMAVASLIFALVFGAGAATTVWLVMKDSRAKDLKAAELQAEMAKDFRGSLRELATTLGGELKAERISHTEKIVMVATGVRDAFAASFSANASQIGSLVSGFGAVQERLVDGFGQANRELINAMDLRAERAGRERDQLLETTTAALDANTRTMARTEKALDHHPRGRANGG